jgi:tRNA(adenine34) deaminase
VTEFSLLDQRYMTLALEQAKLAGDNGEVPVGAIIVKDDQIIGRGSNAPICGNDPTAHAEIVALRSATAAHGNYRLPGTTIYVTLEPCAMCAGALVHARIQRVVCAAREPRAGAGGSIMNVLNHERLNHQCEVEFGLFGDESAHLLKEFFKERRQA